MTSAGAGRSFRGRRGGRGPAEKLAAPLPGRPLRRNHELGFVAEDAEILAGCRSYFDDLWERAGEDLRLDQLDDWDRRLERYRTAAAPPRVPAPAEDFGADLGLEPDPAPTPAAGWIGEAEQAFVKFFGQSTRRADRSMPVFDEVERSGSHFACTYPIGKRPRSWPHYVRVHGAEFVAGSLGNGVSLGKLMEELGSDAFASTRRNAEAGEGNVDPRRAYLRQPAVELSPQGTAWLRDRLERAFAEHGRLPAEQLSRLDWPAVPGSRQAATL